MVLRPLDREILDLLGEPQLRLLVVAEESQSLATGRRIRLEIRRLGEGGDTSAVPWVLAAVVPARIVNGNPSISSVIIPPLEGWCIPKI